MWRVLFGDHAVLGKGRGESTAQRLRSPLKPDHEVEAARLLIKILGTLGRYVRDCHLMHTYESRLSKCSEDIVQECGVPSLDDDRCGW